MGYIEKHLIAGETVLYKTRLHSIAVLGPLLLALLLVAAGGFCFYESMADKQTAADPKVFSAAGLALLVVAIAVGATAIMKRNATEMVVTNRRVLIKTGILSRRTIEMLLARVESIVINEPFLGRMLGYGTIVIRGTGGTPEPFDMIASPNEFRRHVQEQIEAGQPTPKVAG